MSKFPFPNKTLSITEVLFLSKIAIIYSNEKIIYILDIPLVEPDPFKVFELRNIPVPQITDTKEIIFTYIPVESNNIALARSDLQFIPTPKGTLEKCKKIQEFILCDYLEPIQDITNDTSCEIRLVARMPIKVNNCNPILTKLNHTFWKRITKSAWAFAAPKKEAIYIACGQNPIIKAEIHDAGLITLKPNCMAKTQSVQFSSHHKFSSSQKIRSYNNPSLNITKILHDLFNNITTNEIYDFIQNTSLLNIDQKEVQLKLNDIINKAKEFTEFEKIIVPVTNFSLFDNLFDNTIHITIIGFGIIICILILLRK